MRELPSGRRAIVVSLLGLAVAGIVADVSLTALGGEGLRVFVGQWVYNAAFIAAALACLTRAVLVRRERAAWAAFGISMALWAAGDLYWTIAYNNASGPIPYPSIADALYLAVYPFQYVGILLLVRSRVERFPPSLWLDGAIGALAAAAAGAAVLGPVLEGIGGHRAAAVVTNLAYPLADVLLLAFVTSVLVMTGMRLGRDWALLGGGLLFTAIGDAFYLRLEAAGGYPENTPLDAFWLASAALIALAAWSVPIARRRPLRLDGYRSLFFTAVFGLVGAGVLVVDFFAPLHRAAEALATATLLLVVVRLLLAFRENTKLLRIVKRESVTDSLTGLANRRKLMTDLSNLLSANNGPPPNAVFAIYDLDGFKAYNDSFGHSAGDLLLRRMGRNLSLAVEPWGSVYRLGGDEFCLLAMEPAGSARALAAAAGAALREEGQGFEIGSSCGTVMLPREAPDPSEALRLADRRMYAEKGKRESSAERQTRDVLLRILSEREPELGHHLKGVARLAVEMASRLDMDTEELDVLARAAELHDIGKMAIPDEILRKTGPLDEVEWKLIKTHTLIGERILAAAPSMVPVAKLVRSSHERWDGEGYPDGLSGEEIPLGSRVIFVCDAFDAMTGGRPYSEPLEPEVALEELRRGSGTQFDPRLVEAFCEQAHAAAGDGSAMRR